MNVYIGTSGELKNAYIGEYRVPGENTILYLPFESDYTDHSSNSISLTKTGTISFTALPSGKNVASFNQGQLVTGDTFISTYLSSHIYTVNYRINATKNNTNRRNHFEIGTGSQWWTNIEVGATALETNGGGYTQLYCNNNAYGSTSHTGWINVCIVVSGGTATMYVNNTLYTSGSVLTKTDGWLGIGYAGGGNENDRLYGNISEFIVEDKARTAQERTNYYNSTKSNYGL